MHQPARQRELDRILHRLPRRRRIYLLAATTTCLVVVALLKRASALHCPWGLLEFGGTHAYLRLFDAVPPGWERGACFPAGHALSAAPGRMGRMATIVFLHAHPDDEASGTSGTMTRLSREGHRVVVVYGTGGEHGTAPDDPAKEDCHAPPRPCPEVEDALAAVRTALTRSRAQALARDVGR